MQLILYLLAVASAVAVRDDHTVQFGQIPTLNSDFSLEQELPETFIDTIYGQLVDSKASREHKSGLVSSGAVALEDPDFIDEFHISHQQYMKIQTKLNLPSDDDTSDINQSQTFFGGILTYAHFDYASCFDPETYDTDKIDIAVVGAPFDTGTSYRPGARFGPEAVRSSARRLSHPERQSSKKSKKNVPINPYEKNTHNFSIVDCGDVAMTPFDNRIALNQLYRGQRAIHQHTGAVNKIPKIITVGGDHTITLMALKSAYEALGEAVQVVHFDSHLDTWNPKLLGGGITEYMSLNHGTFLHYAHEQGYIKNEGNFHVGIRAPYIDDVYDGQHDLECGFSIIRARDIDTIGVKGIIRKLKASLGDKPVYISVDIDVLDPAFAPGTGTMEIGGLNSRELLSILDGLQGINLIGADVVEVSPPYDTNSEITSLAATSVIDSFLNLIVKKK